MTTDIPGYVRAWAKVHGIKVEPHPTGTTLFHETADGAVCEGLIPDADSDEWLAGMFRAMTGDGGRLVVEHDDRGYAAIWNKPYALGAGVSVGEAPTLKDAICAAVNGGSDVMGLDNKNRPTFEGWKPCPLHANTAKVRELLKKLIAGEYHSLYEAELFEQARALLAETEPKP